KPKFAAKLEELSGALTGWQLEQRDAGLVPEPMLTELDQKGFIRDYVTSDSYPIEEVLQLAQMAGEREAKNLDELLKQLQSGHPVKTYWAATGLLLLGQDAKPALPVIETVLDQVKPWTGVVLAEVLLGFDHTAEATAYLERVLVSDNLMVRLQVMETIVVTGLFDPALKPAIKALIPDDPKQRPYDGRMARYVLKRYESL
ncbi:MAG: hypothetical protein GY732_19220, partial [Gammaproteobacteria bacterium]|nr:hypothetical protein [Gammaproteobacteria bacterium]